MRQLNEETRQVRAVQFITIGDQERVPAPLIRITTCGLLTVEIIAEVVSADPPQALYASLTPEQLRGRGTGPALMLLKLLLNRHERFASREWLMEMFCHDGELFSSARIDNIVSPLRGLLCPPAYPDLRKQLVAHVRNSGSDGYQLAAYPLVWVDQDALAWNIEQATRMERFHDHALPFWERAYELARRGPYLPGEQYADWTTFQREQVAGMLRHSVQALARIYQEQHGAAGEEEALHILRSYWLEHPHEEDVLRPLMELLGRRECTHEALEYYEKLCRLLEEDEREPDVPTQDMVQYLRNKQIQRQPTHVDYSLQIGAFSVEDVDEQSLEGSTTSIQPFETPVVFSRFAGVLTASPQNYLHPALLDRIEVLFHSFTRRDEASLNMLSYLILEAKKRLVKGQETNWQDLLTQASNCLRLLVDTLESHPREGIQQLLLWVGEMTLLIGDVLFNRGENQTAVHYYTTALRAAQEAQDTTLQSVILGRYSLLLIHNHQALQALPLIEKSVHSGGSRGTSLLQAWLWAVKAEVHANIGEEKYCRLALEHSQTVLEQAGDGETCYTFVPELGSSVFSLSKLLGYEGACYLRLHQPEQAKRILAISKEQSSHPHHQSFVHIDFASALIQQQAPQDACAFIHFALQNIEQTRSLRAFERILTVRKQLDLWRNLPDVQGLDEHMHDIRLQLMQD